MWFFQESEQSSRITTMILFTIPWIGVLIESIWAGGAGVLCPILILFVTAFSMGWNLRAYLTAALEEE